MKVTYKGKLDSLLPAQRRKLEAKLDKLAKVVDGREEREVHCILSSERNVQHAELTVNIRDHIMVGASSSPDLMTALTGAIDKLDKQVRKLRTKFRDTHRGPAQSLKATNLEPPETLDPESAMEDEGIQGPQVFRVNHRANQKPMTLEEALLAIDDGRNYLVYRDAESDRLSVLLRRRDGNFDLVEG